MDLTMFPPACLPKKGQHFTGSASVYGAIIVKFIDIFFTGWGQRDWWVTEESDEEWKNDDKLHEVEVK